MGSKVTHRHTTKAQEREETYAGNGTDMETAQRDRQKMKYPETGRRCV